MSNRGYECSTEALTRLSDIAAASVVSISDTHLHVLLFPNHYDRYHQVPVLIPRDRVVVVVDCHGYSEDPHLFLDSAWLEGLFLRTYSVFGLVDAIGIGKEIASGSLRREHFIYLRNTLDDLSVRYPDISFISFGDSILLKSNWTTGYVHTKQKYSYRPESFLPLFEELQQAYHQIFGLDIYAILTQGSNEFYDNTLIHISESRRHVCLNSLGIPFAQIFDIDRTVRSALHDGIHAPAQLYLDESFFLSLNRKYDFGKKQVQAYEYCHKLLPDKGRYYPIAQKTLFDNVHMGQ